MPPESTKPLFRSSPLYDTYAYSNARLPTPPSVPTSTSSPSRPTTSPRVRGSLSRAAPRRPARPRARCPEPRGRRYGSSPCSKHSHSHNHRHRHRYRHRHNHRHRYKRRHRHKRNYNPNPNSNSNPNPNSNPSHRFRLPSRARLPPPRSLLHLLAHRASEARRPPPLHPVGERSDSRASRRGPGSPRARRPRRSRRATGRHRTR